MSPRVVAQDIRVSAIEDRPYLEALSYEPIVKIDGQKYVVPVGHLTGFAHHGSKGIYDKSTGRLDLLVNTAEGWVERADEIFGSEKTQVQAVLENLEHRRKAVNTIYLRASSLQTEAGAKFVNSVKQQSDRLKVLHRDNPKPANDYLNNLFDAMGNQGMLRAVKAVLDKGYFAEAIVSDPLSGTFDPSGDKWIVFRRPPTD